MAHFDPAHNQRPPAHGAHRVAPSKPDERISVTICVRRQNGEQLPDPTQGTLLGRDEFDSGDWGAAPEDMAKVVAFGESHGLVEKERSIPRRLVVLSGTVEQVSAAFGLKLHEYEHPAGERYRGHEDPIHLPADLAEIVEGVFGLDNRKMARAHLASGGMPAAASKLPTPPDIARHYNFPAGDGAGQTIAMLEFDNSYNPDDIRSYFAGLGIPAPAPIAVNLDGANPTSNPPNGEVTLDIAVAGSVAPGAKIVLYFAPYTETGWIHAVGAAVHDSANPPSAISISWGSPELLRGSEAWAWTRAAILKISELFQEAAHLGISVFAATGDRGSSCAMSDGKAHVLYPASDPWVTACGGTMLQDGIQGGTESTEAAWNQGGATGGGISEVFLPPPQWQEGASVPVSINRRGHAGRGIPDVAGYAAGYSIMVGGAAQLSPGTSGVAPLWAGLVALLNQSLGRRLGFLNPQLYGAIRQAGALHAITEGDNNYEETAPFYSAGPGWNACTGLGTPDGMKILAALRTA